MKGVQRPEIAINYSVAADELLRAGRITFDRWKCSPPDDVAGPQLTASSGLPCYVHFPLDAGDPAFHDSDWESIQRILEETRTPFLNLHLNAKKSHFPNIASQNERQVVRDRFLAAVEKVCRLFGPEKVICENVIYRGESGPYLRSSVEPDLITEVIRETGAGLLMDTAHAQISCEYLTGVTTLDYLQELPLEEIREVHVTGSQEAEGRLRDSMPMTTIDWLNAHRVLDQKGPGLSHKDFRLAARPWLVALEYGGVGPQFEWRSDPEFIERDLKALKAMIEMIYKLMEDSQQSGARG